MAELVSLDEIRAAARRLAGVTVRTPLVPVPPAAPVNLLVKPESLQPTGAFKLRGAYNAIASLLEAADGPEAEGGVPPAGVVAHSSGNHGFAVAYAARALGVKAAIVVPNNAPRVKTDAIEAAGAELVKVEPTLDARLAGMARIADERGYARIPPFDDRRVIAGQGTVGLEIAEDFARRDVMPAAVLVPVSGGGLISGVAAAVTELLPDTRVIGVEPELAADARESLHTGRRVRWQARDVTRTKADALRVEQIGELPFAHIRAQVSDIVTVSEKEILGTVRKVALQARLIAEPGGAVAIAAALHRGPVGLGLPGDDPRPIVAILSGGNIDPALLSTVLD